MVSAATRVRVAAAVAMVLALELVIGSVVALNAGGTPVRSAPMNVAVIGDSYAAGLQNRTVWPTLLAQRTGWAVANFALPAAGFLADGDGGHAFTYQADRALAADPSVVLIVGGLADTRYSSTDTAAVTMGAIDTINKITRAGRQALIVGPTWYRQPVPAAVTRISRTVQDAAEDAGVPFLDALNPPWLTPALMRPDLSGPNDAGQSVIADKVAAWLTTRVQG